jgi:Domain of unknown function (DUF4190)
VALVLGYVALSQIRRSGGNQQGRGLALAGVILGWIGLALTIVFIFVIVVVQPGEEPDGSGTYEFRTGRAELKAIGPGDAGVPLSFQRG